MFKDVRGGPAGPQLARLVRRLLLVLAVILTVTHLIPTALGWNRPAYGQTEGEILVFRDDDRGNDPKILRGNLCVVVYQYRVDGMVYQNSAVTFSDPSGRIGWAETCERAYDLRALKVGRRVPVYYFVRDPQHAALTPIREFSDSLQLASSAVVLVLLLVMYFKLRPGPRRGSSGAEDEEKAGPPAS